jgi:hypothetical protein
MNDPFGLPQSAIYELLHQRYIVRRIATANQIDESILSNLSLSPYTGSHHPPKAQNNQHTLFFVLFQL